MTEKFPDLASTDNYLLWIEPESGMITLAMPDRGLTLDLTIEDLDELAGALSKARAKVRKLGLGGRNQKCPSPPP
jgi:hypothetical protein